MFPFYWENKQEHFDQKNVSQFQIGLEELKKKDNKYYVILKIQTLEH